MYEKLIVFGLFASSFLSGCGAFENDDPCEPLLGNYTGRIDGSPLSGQLQLTVSGGQGSLPGTVIIFGTWVADNNGYAGEINSFELDCESKRIQYDFGLSLNAPKEKLCPKGTEKTTRCYDQATLGSIKGNLTSQNASGSWNANSGAAMTVGGVGSGTWSVSKM